MSAETREISCAGVYVKLKDRNTSLDNKLKLLQFAWKSRDVFIPNKEQVLIDQLCGYLINRKKHQFTEDEVGKIFSCLEDILQSKKAHANTTHKQGMLVKQSLSQMIIDALLSKTEFVGAQDDYLSHVIGCCHAIINSPSLAYLFTDRLDLMVSLICSLCTLLLNSVTNSVDHAQLAQLVQDTTALFMKNQISAPDQNLILKLTYEKLLPPFIKLYSLSQCDAVVGIRTSILNVTCHRDHTQNYKAYLCGVYEEKVPDQIDQVDLGGVKLIKELFESFAALLKKEVSHHESVCDFLVHYYEKFTENKRNEEHYKVCHFVMKKLCAVIGVNEEDSTLVDTVAPPVVINGVRRLLQIVLKFDLYNVSADNRNKHLERTFYRCIAKILLDSDCLTLDWYTCCHVLLQLNHHILEPFMMDLLVKAFIGGKEQKSGEVLNKIDEFLTELVVTYHKLRQFHALVVILMNTMKKCKGRDSIELPPKFIQSYGECVQALPQGTVLTVWKTYLDCMVQDFVTAEVLDQGYFQGICCLLYHFITNVKIIDYSITEMTLNSVKDNLDRMSTDLFVPLLQKQAESEKFDVAYLRCLLDLCYGWGEVVVMVTMYCGYKMEELQTKTFHPEAHNVSMLHTYLRKKHWKLLYKKIQLSESMCIQYNWELLLVQKIRTILLCRDVSEWSTVHESMESLIKFPHVVTTADLSATWSGLSDDITNDNILVARWSLVVSNLPLLYSNLSQEHMENLACFIVNTCGDLNTRKRKEMTVESITQEFLNSVQFKEFGRLISYIITAVWRSMSDCLVGTKSRSKKRKSEAQLETAVNVFRALSDTNINWTPSMSSEVLEKILEASKCLTDLLQSNGKANPKVSFTKFTSCLQVLKCLPLEHLLSSNQIRCLIGLLSVSCLVHNTENQEGLSDLSSQSIELCMVILESTGMSPIFQVIDVETYMMWLSRLFPSHLKTDNSLLKMILFVEFSCSAIVKDYKVLIKLPAFVQKIQPLLPTKASDLDQHTGPLVLVMQLYQEISRMMGRHHMNDDLKDSCRDMHASLSKQVITLLSCLKNPTFSLIEGIIVNCFSNMVQSCVKEESLRDGVLKKLPEVLKWCESILKKEVDLYSKMAALHFFQSASRCHQVLDSVLSSDTKHQIWRQLVWVLKVLIKNQQKLPDNLQLQKSLSTKTSDMDSKHIEHDAISDLLMEVSNSIDKKTQPITDKKNIQTKKEENIVSYDTSAIEFVDIKFCDLFAVGSLFHSLAFEGRLQEQSTRVLIMEVQSVMASILASFDIENFTTIVEGIVNDVHVSNLTRDRQTIQCYLFVWQYLLKLEFSDQHSQIIQTAAEKIVTNSQDILLRVQHQTDDLVVMETVLPILRSQCQMLKISNKFLLTKAAALCLQGCLNVQLGGATLFPVFHASCELLDTLLMKHTNVVLLHIPAFIGFAKKLLVSLVKHSDQKLVVGDHAAISSLTGCAYQLERLFLEISNHKVDFNKVAVYVISDYVTAVEHVTLLPSLKRAILPVVYKMLDLCDNFSVSQLHKILSYGQVEVFKILYEEYIKFHKFSGKV